jgi:hypothetical protein
MAIPAKAVEGMTMKVGAETRSLHCPGHPPLMASVIVSGKFTVRVGLFFDIRLNE